MSFSTYFDANHRKCTGRFNDPPEFPIPSPPSFTFFSRHDHSPHRCRDVVDEGLKLDIEHKEDSSDSCPQVRLGPYIRLLGTITKYILL